SFHLLRRRPPRSPPFPYTTLFRSIPRLPRTFSFGEASASTFGGCACGFDTDFRSATRSTTRCSSDIPTSTASRVRSLPPCIRSRSEEHTSELQSRFDLVCRLLLEK